VALVKGIETGPQGSAKREGIGFEPALDLGMRLLLITLESQQIVAATGGDLLGNRGSAGERVQTDQQGKRMRSANSRRRSSERQTSTPVRNAEADFTTYSI
jgi:hypothetical protein